MRATIKAAESTACASEVPSCARLWIQSGDTWQWTTRRSSGWWVWTRNGPTLRQRFRPKSVSRAHLADPPFQLDLTTKEQNDAMNGKTVVITGAHA